MKERTKLKYELGLNRIKEKLSEMNLEIDTLNKSNPIEHIKYRLKSLDSIKNKLDRKNLEYKDESIEKNINDVIGARIVCPFLSDVNELIERLKSDPEIEIIGYKDYISNPKKNGYSSYHLIIRVPISIEGKIEYVNAELQIRTIIQDMLASLDHKISYKKNISYSPTTEESLKQITDKCNDLDRYFNKHYLAQSGKKKDTTLNEELFEETEYKKMMSKYETALNIVGSIIAQIDNSYKINEMYFKKANPIEHIKSRIKTPQRIISKVKEETDDISVESIENTISDIAGIRIVCSFLSDLEEIKNVLKNYLDLEIVKEKDYVTHPKANGYLGYHIIVNIPVLVDEKIEKVKVEIQVRTIAMDMWAIIERNLRPREITIEERERELHALADIRNEIDYKMESIIRETRQRDNKKALIKSPTKK